MDSEQASRLRQEASRLIAERQRIEGELVGRHRLVRGSLLERPRFCGKAGSKCGPGQPPPPPQPLSQSSGGWSASAYLYQSCRPWPGTA